MKLPNVLISIILLAIIFLLIFPLPEFMMDMLLIINIAISLAVLLFSLYIKNPLEFSIFPTLLLFLTLFRLALNLSSTRLILGNQGNAGNVIRAFGSVVIGNNIVIGAISFLIIMMVQFIVITKGAERVAEVSARFTLDAMPGKQMAIDADLSSGIIDETEARDRRDKIYRESDFNGAMDGASKFIKGDAILGILITFVNIIGGIIIGYTTMNMPLGDVVSVFILATIGDGLVSQIPALLISFSSGIIVTRNKGDLTFGEEVSTQILRQPFVIMMAGVLLLIIGIIPGLPHIPMFFFAAVIISAGYMMYTRGIKQEALAQADEAEKIAEERRQPEGVASLLQIDPLELYVGFGLVPMIDHSQGGDLIDRVTLIRRQIAYDLGILVPKIRVRDDLQLGANVYSIYIKGVEVARGEVMADYLLALPSGEVEMEIAGIPTVDPTYGVPALWIPKSEREDAEMYGYSTFDPPTVISLHLTEIVRRHSHELLSRQQVQKLLDNLRQSQPALVDEAVPKMFSLGEVQKVLAALLEEDVPIRDMATIIETLADNGNITRDTEMLTEYVRQALKRTISKRFIPNKEARVITLDPALEQLIADSTRKTERGSYLAMEMGVLESVSNKLRESVETIANSGNTPIILTSPLVRRQFREIAERISPELVVMSFNELDLEQNIEVFAEGVVTV